MSEKRERPVRGFLLSAKAAAKWWIVVFLVLPPLAAAGGFLATFLGRSVLSAQVYALTGFLTVAVWGSLWIARVAVGVLIASLIVDAARFRPADADG